MKKVASFYSRRSLYIDFKLKEIGKGKKYFYIHDLRKKLTVKDLNSLLKCLNFFIKISRRYEVIDNYEFKKIMNVYGRYITSRLRYYIKMFNFPKMDKYVSKYFGAEVANNKLRLIKNLKIFKNNKTRVLNLKKISKYVKLKRLVKRCKIFYKKKRYKYKIKPFIDRFDEEQLWFETKLCGGLREMATFKKNFKEFKLKNSSIYLKTKFFNYTSLFNLSLKKMFLYKIGVFKNTYYKIFFKTVRQALKLTIKSRINLRNSIFLKFKANKKFFVKWFLIRKRMKTKSKPILKKIKLNVSFKKKLFSKKKTFKKLIKNIFVASKKKKPFFFKLNSINLIKRFLNKLFLKFMNKGNKNFIKKVFFSFLIFLKRKYFKLKKKMLFFNFLYVYINQILVKSSPSLNFMFTKSKGNFIKIPRIYIASTRVYESNMSLVLIWLKKSVSNRTEKNIFLKLISEFESIRSGKSEIISLRKNYYFEIKNNLRKIWRKRRYS